MQKYELMGMPVVIASRSMADLFDTVRRIAPANVAVLIEGESGTGKEAVARALHAFSNRSSKPWVDISCAALPEHLVESELFGFEKGAFSGAHARKPGLFEAAEGGTLFLDEIGEIDPRIQVKLLRVLDNGEFYRLGGTAKVRTNVRIVAATNRPLEAAIQTGQFRRDLFHRLSQIKLRVPPLRERVADIAPLARFFCETQNRRLEFPPEVVRALEEYGWPGNVRELRNTMIRLAALSDSEKLEVSQLPPEILEPERDEFAGPDLMALATITGSYDDQCPSDGYRLDTETQREPMSRGGVLENAEKTLVLQVLRQANGHQERAARILGISPRTLSRKLRSYRIEGLEQGLPGSQNLPM